MLLWSGAHCERSRGERTDWPFSGVLVHAGYATGEAGGRASPTAISMHAGDSGLNDRGSAAAVHSATDRPTAATAS